MKIQCDEVIPEEGKEDGNDNDDDDVTNFGRTRLGI